MASTYTQDKRIVRFNTPFGKDVLVLRRFDSVEAISELFEFKIEAITKEKDLDFDRAIGKNCTLTMKTVEGGNRYFDGILTETEFLGDDEEGQVYRLILRPWLWLLSKTTNCLIFHEKTAPEIIAEVLDRHSGLGTFEQLLSKNYPKLEYCVQYRESDMDFVRRLMENHGIGFHFRHGDGRHVLVMGDGMRAYKPIQGKERPYIEVEKQHQREKEYLYHWAPVRKFTTGRVTLDEYDFKRPSAKLTSMSFGDAKYEHSDLEDYDYPGKFGKEGDGGDLLSQRRLDRARAEDGRFHASGDCLSCEPGMLVTLTDHPQRSQNRQYLALRCTHEFVSEAYRSRSDTAGDTYGGRYEFMEATRSFAPPCVTGKPYLRGPQTALVVGGGDIDCDKFGRIIVQFPWDRKKDHSMRARVAQVWASDRWGGVFIPRVGMEVIVDFLEGDPDQPIVIGCVYNGQNMPPYDLPDDKNIAGWKSNSTPQGSGYNEFIMDDTARKELVRVHAQRDLDVTVQHDEKRHVVQNRTTDVDVNDTLKVGDKLMIEAGTEITLKVGGSTIVINPTSISLKSMDISVNASANLATKASAMASHKSDGPMEIKGLIVNIN